MIKLFASSCRCTAQLQLSSSCRAPRWTWGQEPCQRRSREIGFSRPLRRPVNQESEGRAMCYLVCAGGGGPGRGWWAKGEGSRPARRELGPLCSVSSLVLELGCRQMPGLKIEPSLVRRYDIPCTMYRVLRTPYSVLHCTYLVANLWIPSSLTHGM